MRVGWEMLGDISYHKVTLQSEGKHSIQFIQFIQFKESQPTEYGIINWDVNWAFNFLNMRLTN